MTALAAIGYCLFAFGPVTALFFGTVACNPHEVILLILGAFFFLVAYLLTALSWVIVPPLWNTPIIPILSAVPLQEFFRWCYYKMLKRVDKMLALVSGDSTDLRKHKQAYVGGMGFGLMSSALAGINMIQLSGGPATAGLFPDRLPEAFFIETALSLTVFIFLHICWGVLWFDAFEKKSYLKGAIVLLSHSAVAILSAFNLYFDRAVSAPVVLSVQVFLLVGLIVCSLWTAGAKPTNFKYLFFIR